MREVKKVDNGIKNNSPAGQLCGGHFSFNLFLMKKILLLGMVLFVTSCAGMKVLKEPPPAEKAKSGLTLNSGAIGAIQVQKVGFWCEAKQSLMTFGAFGSTEEKGKASAQEKCRAMFKDSPCESVSCKPSSEEPTLRK